MIDHKIVDSHVHLADPQRFSYPWTAGAPSLNRTVLPADLSAAAAPYEIDRFVFVEVDVEADPPLLDCVGMSSQGTPNRGSNSNATP